MNFSEKIEQLNRDVNADVLVREKTLENVDFVIRNQYGMPEKGPPSSEIKIIFEALAPYLILKSQEMKDHRCVNIASAELLNLKSDPG